METDKRSVFPNILLKIIEELTDGLIILNHNREVLFFNDAFQKMVGWRSEVILTPENSFIQSLDIEHPGSQERAVEIPDAQDRSKTFSISSFKIMSEDGFYFLVRLRSVTDTVGKKQQLFDEHYKILFNNIGDALLTADLNGRIIAANPAFYSLLGIDPQKPPENIAHVYVYGEALEEKIMRLTETGILHNRETHFHTGDKGVKRILDSSWVIKDEAGIIKGYTSHFKDVTYLKNLKSRLDISEQNYVMLFDTVISSIVIVDLLGTIVNRNYAAEQLYGYTWEKAVGRSFDELFRIDAKRPVLKEIFAWVDENSGRYVEANVPRLCEGGVIKYTYASYLWIKNSFDEVIAYAVMERDFTERVKLEGKLREAIKEIKETQTATILGFARLTEYREKDAGKHLDRIKNYTKVLATELSMLPKYRGYITEDYIEDLCLSSVLHDIGKIGIEDAILFKSGKLTRDEFEQVKEHVSIGGQALRAVDTEIKRESFLTIGKEIAYSHHEWWDGSGYPEGKKGMDIPLSARIVALADVYDALTTSRAYKKTYTHEEAVEEFRKEAGTHFDPEIVSIFMDKNEVFKRIKIFSEFQENPETIDDILGGRLKVDLHDLKVEG